MDSNSVTIQLTPEDIRRYTRFATPYRGLFPLWLVGAVVPVIVGANLLTYGISWLQSPKFALFAAVLGIGGFFYWRTTTRLLSATHPPVTIRVLDRGLFCESERGETLTRWSSVIRFVETREDLYVLLGPQSGHVIPKRCFATQEAVASFAQQLRQQLERHAPAALAGK